MKALSALQYFSIAFGGVVGTTWIAGLGGLIARAGPLSAALALALSGTAITLVAMCYGEMASARSGAGGELVYAYDLGGSAASFATGWMLLLLYVSSCAFLAVSFGTVVDMLFPGIAGPILYRFLGEEVHLGALGLGLGCALLLWWVNRRGAQLSARAQELVTYARLALMAGFLLVALVCAHPANHSSFFSHAQGETRGGGFLSVLAAAPFLYNGFTVFAAMTEESLASMKAVGRAVAGSVVGAMIFYIALILCLSALTPWRNWAALNLPTTQMFDSAVGTPWAVKLVLVTALLGNLTAWNSFLLAGSRVQFALARAGLTSPRYAQLLPGQRTPAAAIALISLVSIIVIFLGRGFLVPLANISSACFGAMYVVTCLTLLKLRRLEPDAGRAFAVPGGRLTILAALIVSALLTVVALVQPMLAGGRRIPGEWIALAFWSLLGGGFWLSTRRFRLAMSEETRTARLGGL